MARAARVSLCLADRGRAIALALWDAAGAVVTVDGAAEVLAAAGGGVGVAPAPDNFNRSHGPFRQQDTQQWKRKVGSTHSCRRPRSHHQHASNNPPGRARLSSCRLALPHRRRHCGARTGPSLSRSRIASPRSRGSSPCQESRFSVAPGLGTILTSMLTSTRTDRHADEQLARWTSLALLAGLGMI